MKEFFGLSMDVKKDHLLKSIGGGSNRRPSPRTLQEMIKAIETIRALARPQAVYSILPARTDGGFIHINGEVTLKSKRLAGVLSRCKKAAVFVLTLGPEVDRVIHESIDNCIHYSAILDAAASIAAESGAQSVKYLIENTLPKGEGVTMSYSPGYCNWRLKEQEKLFKLFPRNPAGVRLSSDQLMSPRKSLSGILGIGPSEVVKRYGNACLECLQIDCSYRRK